MGKPPSCDKTAAIRESKLISSASLQPFVSEQLLLVSLFPQDFNTNATNNTGWQWFSNDRLTVVSVNRSHFLHICRFSVFPRITPSEKTPNLSTCDNTSLRVFKHCIHSSTIFLCAWTPPGCYSGHVYSEQSFSAVFLSAVLTHCDGLLPVASHPVLQTQTSPKLIREFIVNSRGGHPVPLPLLTRFLPWTRSDITHFLALTENTAHK